METLSFDSEWRKKFINSFLPIDDDNIIISDDDVWWMDIKSHNLEKNIGEPSYDYDGEAWINFVSFLKDGSLFIVKEFYSNHEDPRTDLDLWKMDENKEWIITKEEEFEGNKHLMIDNIYFYEDDTFIFNSFENGLYTIKILNK